MVIRFILLHCSVIVHLLQVEEYNWVLQEEVPLVLQDVFNILTVCLCFCALISGITTCMSHEHLISLKCTVLHKLCILSNFLN